MIGKKIRNLLVIKAMSSQELANRCGLAKYSIDAIIYGRSKRSDIIEQIAQALDVTVQFLSENNTSVLHYETTNLLESQNVDVDLLVQAILLSNEALKNKNLLVTKGNLLYYANIIYDHLIQNDHNYEKAKGFIEGILDKRK
jgi:transcriptional regulator with XRE-family HTH domain